MVIALCVCTASATFFGGSSGSSSSGWSKSSAPAKIVKIINVDGGHSSGGWSSAPQPQEHQIVKVIHVKGSSGHGHDHPAPVKIIKVCAHIHTLSTRFLSNALNNSLEESRLRSL